MDYNNLLIEARQKNGSNVYNNGDWNTTLSKPIKIEAGDQIVINKAFVDTQAQTDQKIIIEQEFGQITLHLENYLYSTNWNNTEQDKLQQEGTTQNDGQDYFFCYSKPATDVAPAGYHTITKLEVSWDGSRVPHGWGDGTGLIEFIGLDDQPHEYRVTVPQKDVVNGVPDSYSQFVTTSFTCKDGTIKQSTKKGNNWSHISCNLTKPIPPPNSETAPVSKSIYPYTFPLDIPISAGSYDPVELCGKINDAMTTNLNANVEFPVNNLSDNNFLKHSGMALTGANPDYFCKSDGNQFYSYQTGNRPNGDPRPFYWFGANQVELDWDDAESRFYWKFLHAPVYGTGGTLTSRVIKDEQTNQFFHLGKNGGIVWASLSATCTDSKSIHFQESYDFWEKKLGFNLSSLCRQVEVKKEHQIIGGAFFHTWFFNNHGNGLDTTSARPNIDSLVDKINFQTVPDPSTVNSDNDLTMEIYAVKSVMESIVLDYGFYYVEIQAGFQTEIISGDTVTQNISGILNRFYSLGAYTSGGQESGLVYTHRGADMYLRDVRIRILDSDRNLANSIGEDNTVFIQVIRGQPPQLTPYMTQQLQAIQNEKGKTLNK